MLSHLSAMPTFHHEHALQVQTAVGSLRESAVNRTSHLQKEISTAQDLTSSVREKWGFYMEETEKNYAEDTKAVDSGRSCLAEVLVEWSVHFSVMPCDGGYSFWFEDADVLNFFFFTFTRKFVAARRRPPWVHSNGRTRRILCSASAKETWSQWIL
jgi:hypothetical protein